MPQEPSPGILIAMRRDVPQQDVAASEGCPLIASRVELPGNRL
ncbi:MAG: hypothetical protein ACLUPV_02795 [Bilophila wadsworthia]